MRIWDIEPEYDLELFIIVEHKYIDIAINSYEWKFDLNSIFKILGFKILNSDYYNYIEISFQFIYEFIQLNKKEDVKKLINKYENKYNIEYEKSKN